jgi:hypothetical protein
MDSLPYLELLKKSLAGLDRYTDRGCDPVDPRRLSAIQRFGWFFLRWLFPKEITLVWDRPLRMKVREHEKDEPLHAPARMGMWRLHNLEVGARQIIRDEIPGDFMETGAWRGGGSILWKGVLHAYGLADRSVWVVDQYAAGRITDKKGISVSQVEQYFTYYGLLDDRIHIRKGMPDPEQMPERLAFVRIADTGHSAFRASLYTAYDRLQAGGYIQIDQYYADPVCQAIVDDFRAEQDIQTPIEKVDWSGVFWRKPKRVSREQLPDSSVLMDFVIQQHASEKQNFFHHVWGYLLPALHYYLTKNKPHLLFQSGGPYMDPVTVDLLTTLEVPYSILRDWEVLPDDVGREELPRWEPLVFKQAASQNGSGGRKVTQRDEHSKATNNLPENIAMVRRYVLEKVLPNRPPSINPGTIIILDRADENMLYQRGGLARANTYGKGHRALLGIPAAVEDLADRGIPVAHYTASKYAYTQQIVDFYHCGGVVGIRGAEFAHLIWMRPGTKVLMYQPSSMRPRNIQKPLADLMGLDFQQVDVDTIYPELRGQDILKHFAI